MLPQAARPDRTKIVGGDTHVTPTGVATLCALCFVNVLVALAVLLRPWNRRPRLGSPHLLGAMAAVALLSLAEAALLRDWSLSLGGIFHLAWLNLVLVAPYTGVGLLLAHRFGLPSSPAARWLAWSSLLTIPIAIYALWIEPFNVRLEHTTVTMDETRVGESPVTVGVLADIQMQRVTDYERDALRLLMSQKPDIILIPGDIFAGTHEGFLESLPEIQRLLSLLSAPGGVWIVPGDADAFPEFHRVLIGTSARILRNKIVDVSIRDRQIRLLGLENGEGQREPVRAFELLPGDDDIRLVLVHRPRAIRWLREDSRVDLLIAGHTHGGQVGLPYLGPMYVGSPLPNEVAAGGLHELNGRRLYISRGLGMERGQAPQIRFLVPPEITLLTLR
jgi:predicted MPP superfamily phosphohydrolase